MKFGRKLSRAQNFGKKINKAANRFGRKVSDTVDRVDSGIERGLDESKNISRKVANTSDKINRRLQKSGGLINDVVLAGSVLTGQPELAVLSTGITQGLRASDRANRRVKKGSMRFDGEVDKVRQKHKLER